MPLSEAEQNCLNYIKSDAGVVSTAGKIMVRNELGRGNRTAGTLTDARLDILSRVFFKAELKNPLYTCLISDQTNKFVLSYMSEPPRFALRDDQVTTIRHELQNFTYDDDHKINLFKIMYRCRNDILQQKLIEHTKAERVKFLKSEENNFDFFKKAQDYYNEVESEEILSDLLFDQFAKNYFDELLPNIQDALNLLPADAEIHVMNTLALSGAYEAIHVEVKGVHYFQEQIAPTSHIFEIGLAYKHYNKQGGCCAGCSAEFRAVSAVNPDYHFHRTGDFCYNFPPNKYQPSPLITTDPEDFRSFAKIIYQSLSSAKEDYAELAAITDHPFFTSFDFVQQEIQLAEHNVELSGAEFVIPTNITI